MSRRLRAARPALLALPALVMLCAVLVAGCAQLEGMLGKGLSTTPGAEVRGAWLQGLDLKGVDVVLDVAIDNPYEVPLPLLGLDYDLGHGAQTVVKGTLDAHASVPPKARLALPVTMRVDFAPLLALAGDIKPGAVVDYLAHVGFTVDVPGAGHVRVPLEHSGSFPVPTAPEVSLNSLHWEKLSMTEAAAELDLGLRNGNAFAVNLQQLQYDLKLGGTPVASSSVPQGLALGSQQAGDVKLKLSLKPADLGLAAFNMFAGSGAAYDLRGSMKLGSDFGSMDLPYARQGNVAFTK